ncbi:MAG: arylesterase [Wenzhouxiangella sp.]
MLKRISIVGLFAVLLAAGGVRPAGAATVLIVGDSLSDAYDVPREAGWAQRLSDRLGEAYTIVNASISGETTAGAVRRIDGLLEKHRPELVLIILGGNDGLRGLSPKQIENNLAAIIEQGKSGGAQVALMQIRLPANLGPTYIERFEAVYPRLAERFDVALVPFFLEDLFDRPGMLMQDGIHPTVEAQPEMLDNLWPHLASLLGIEAETGSEDR